MFENSEKAAVVLKHYLKYFTVMQITVLEKSFLRQLTTGISVIFIIGCAGSHEQVFKNIRPQEFDKTIFKTAKNLNFGLRAYQRGVDSTTQSGAYSLYHYGSSASNNTGFSGYLRWDSSASGVRFGIEVSTAGGDGNALSHLFSGALDQQIKIDRGFYKPFVNKEKTMPVFLGYGLLSPTLATWYLTHDNPLISSKLIPLVYLQSGIGEWPWWISSVLYAIKPTPGNRDAFYGCLGLSFVWRFVMVLYTADLHDYNMVARSPYNLQEIVRGY